ncbi:MAG: hypothetical protein U9R23_06605 [Candidatus Cloacimonadota bacterium]|nr:hypothetical protein [Candidatus Cloacimonadota bacterium]
MKVYAVFFQSEDYPEPFLENIFTTKELAKKYAKIERIKRELRADELWIEERKAIDSEIDFCYS